MVTERIFVDLPNKANRVPESFVALREKVPGIPEKGFGLVKPEIEVKVEVREERQVIVHLHFLAFPGALIRVWPSTYLIPSENPESRIPMVHAENISLGPVWTEMESFGIYSFTLFFGGLPEGCRKFDLVEEIEQSGAFYFSDILRTPQDVYHLWI